MTVYGVHVPVVERMIILWGVGMGRYRSAMYGRVWPCGVWGVAWGVWRVANSLRESLRESVG